MKQSSKKRSKISRQISVVALGLVSAIALLMSTGLVVFTSEAPGGFEVISESAPPLADPANPFAEPAPLDEPLISPDGSGDSLTILVTCFLVILAFVLVWFLVFRPGDAPAISSADLVETRAE